MMLEADHRSNNFDFVRHLAAFLVICGHCQALLGLPQTPLWGNHISSVGVMIFFSLSGYLVTASWDREPDLIRFFIKRSLRIFPALIVCVLACAFILGPALSRLPLNEYFEHPFTYRYLSNIWLYIQYHLPGIFESNPLPHAVNGSLWSLPVEFLCYIAVAFLSLGALRYRTTRVMIFCAALTAAALYLVTIYKGPQLVLYATDVASASSVMPFFFIGSLIYLFRIPLRLDFALVAVFGLFALNIIWPNRPTMLGLWIMLPYVTLAFGRSQTPILRRWGRFGDFSYGMYLYSFPVGQALIVLYKPVLGTGGFILATTAVSVAIAATSWHVVEKRALQLKQKTRSLEVSPTTMPTQLSRTA